MIKFAPARLLDQSMPESERERTVVLLDPGSEPAPKEKDAVRLLVNVLFRTVPFKPPLVGGLWHVASTGADISVKTSVPCILDYRKGEAVEFSFRVEKSDGTTVTLSLKPEIELEAGPAKAKFSAPGVERAKNRTDSQAYEYKDKENKLSVVVGKKFAEWEFAMVKGKHAIRDYLHCNLELWVDCKKKPGPLKGTIELIPSIFHFNRDKERMSIAGSILAHFTLAHRHKKILHGDGMKITFEDDGA
jgi:hypothetical protein